ncbi:C40 family peptidase [Ramlibacter rhizophilus]|nr:C40 family peptidase [Ramlibacter rhizophilus]
MNLRSFFCLLVVALSLVGCASPPQGGGRDIEGPSATSPRSPAEERNAADLVVHAMGFVGVPYRLGGNSAQTGFDCSGFVKAVFEQTRGVALPRRADEQAATTQVIDRQDLQPGDLVFFNTLRRAYSHVGIYVGDGRFIHSPRAGAEVRVESMQGRYWARRFDGARRVMASTGSAQTGY